MGLSTDVRARTIAEYLYLRDSTSGNADIVIGFGHFDSRIALRCGEFYRRGMVRRILFTGGRGAGTADIEGSEAGFFRAVLRDSYPEIPDQDIVLEEESTNTSENIMFSVPRCEARWPDLGLTREGARIILVASPYRQRRVALACRKHFPRAALLNAPPETTFEEEEALFAAKDQSLAGLLTGEVARILAYPARGYIADADVPGEVVNCYRALVGEATE